MADKGPSIPRRLIASPLAQFVLFAFTVLYVASPVDVIPDLMPVIGWLDDLAVFVTQVSAFLMYVKERRQRVSDKQRESTGGK